MGRNKSWTKEEVEFLQENWGKASMKVISTHLGRTTIAVRLKATRLHLGDPLLSYDGITISQLAIALGVRYSTVKNWAEKHDLPARRKLFAYEQRVLVIKYDSFWKWAKEHKHLINLAEMEPNILGPEPEWVKTKRAADRMSYQRNPKRRWLKSEVKRLLGMVNSHKYTYREIANRLQRSEFAVKRKLQELGVKARPVSRNNLVKYTPEEVKILAEMFDKGYGYDTIAEKVGKSALGIQSKLERMGYRTRKQG